MPPKTLSISWDSPFKKEIFQLGVRHRVYSRRNITRRYLGALFAKWILHFYSLLFLCLSSLFYHCSCICFTRVTNLHLYLFAHFLYDFLYRTTRTKLLYEDLIIIVLSDQMKLLCSFTAQCTKMSKNVCKTSWIS